MHGVYIGHNKMLVTPVWGGKLLVPADDLSVGLDLVATGFFESPLTNYLIKNVGRNHTVIDIGANLGYYTVLLGYLVGPGGQVIAYEPNPKLYSFLMDNLSINYLHDRATTHQKAAYSAETNLDFHITTRFMGNSSIHQHDTQYFKHYADDIETTSVQAEPLDKHSSRLSQVDLVKIDIEGGEYQAFLGMQNMLKANIIKTIVFELNKERLMADWQPLSEFLLNLSQQYHKAFFTLSDQGDLVPAKIQDLLDGGSYPFVVMTSTAHDE